MRGGYNQQLPDALPKCCFCFFFARTGLKSSFVARLARCEARRGKRAKQPEVYPPRYTEDFFERFDEVAARISSTEAEDTFETSSNPYFSRSSLRSGICKCIHALEKRHFWGCRAHSLRARNKNLLCCGQLQARAAASSAQNVLNVPQRARLCAF
jgi:hypothetical protein